MDLFWLGVPEEEVIMARGVRHQTAGTGNYCNPLKPVPSDSASSKSFHVLKLPQVLPNTTANRRPSAQIHEPMGDNSHPNQKSMCGVRMLMHTCVCT